MNKNLFFNAALAASVLGLAGCAALQQTGKPADKQQPTVQFGPLLAPPAQPPAIQSPQQGRPELKVYPGTGVLIKQMPVVQPAEPGPEDVVLNFEGVDIRQVIETILSTYLREPYVVHPSLAGTVTFRTTRGIPKKDLIPTLEMLLRMNGFALAREDGIYKVVPFGQVRGSVTPQLGAASTPLPIGFSVAVVPLKYIGAKAMLQILEPFATDGSAVRADEVRNLAQRSAQAADLGFGRVAEEVEAVAAQLAELAAEPVHLTHDRRTLGFRTRAEEQEAARAAVALGSLLRLGQLPAELVHLDHLLAGHAGIAGLAESAEILGLQAVAIVEL